MSLLPSPLKSSGATLLLALVSALCVAPATARGVYQQPAEFIAEAFSGANESPKIIWLTQEIQSDIKKILTHNYPSLRLRYWRRNDTTAWILEETGKERPITLGVVVKADRIERLSVLIFREKRGDEIRHAFFTDQFARLTLNSDLKLNDDIDGISGATLSVRAAEKIARLALYLHKQVTDSP
jgi:hypothetical protein